MKITEIKKDIRRKLKSSIDEITERAEDIMNEELEGFYNGGTPVYYKRTYTLRNTPQVTDQYCSSNSAGVTLSLNQDISYGTGNFTGAEVIDAAEHGTAGIVGRSGFWERSEDRIKETVDDVISKNIKYAKDTFLMMLSIARNNVYSEKFSNDDGEIVFFVTNKKLAEYMGKSNSQKKIDKVSKYIKMLIYHDLIRILDDSQVPKELLMKAIKYSGTDKRSGNHVSFYAIPSWVIQQLKTIENNGICWKDKGYRIGGVSFDMFYRSEGFDIAASLYPQYKKKKNEYGEIVNRTTTQASDERTMKISEVILKTIQRKGYCTEKEVVYILGNQYRYEVTETQIKRCLNEIMDSYGLKKVKANKVLKEQYQIKSNGYPNIIIEDTIE